MKRLLFGLLVIFCCNQAYSQDYGTGIGVKFGSTNGLSFKQFISSTDAFEIIVGSKYRGVHALALYEVHASAFEVPGLYWYYGGGGHIGFWEGRNYSFFDDDKTFVGIGVDGVIGMEYKINEIPVTLSLDLVPAFNIIGYTGFWLDGGLGIRYVF